MRLPFYWPGIPAAWSKWTPERAGHEAQFGNRSPESSRLFTADKWSNGVLILPSAPTIVISSCPPHSFPSFPHNAFSRDSLKCPQDNSRYGKVPVRFHISEAFPELLLDLVHDFLLMEKALLVDLLHHPIGNILLVGHLNSIHLWEFCRPFQSLS